MKKIVIVGTIILLAITACNNSSQEKKEVKATKKVEKKEEAKLNKISVILDTDSSMLFTADIPETGRYRVTAFGKSDTAGSFWIEDYIENKDGRTYNITGSNSFGGGTSVSVDGAPLSKGKHKMKLHIENVVELESLQFDLMKHHVKTPESLKQKMKGEEWSLVWSDEFDGEGLPDKSKWNYNIGNWGWGNNEPQYYTEDKLKNARQENGTLIIEAHKNDEGHEWTSARLSTQGKVSFTYGKIEFRAKVPTGRGTWSAGWLLGDDYRDELSWPYCGEIDVLECVGFEINDSTGKGLNHATCHTRSYYFKQGNQIGSEIEVDSMNTKFHTYAVEWYPDVIKGFLDGEHYYTYDKNKDSLEWPFNKPQNIIINLAIGGGWGGAEGIDSTLNNPKYILDYVRVYEKK